MVVATIAEMRELDPKAKVTFDSTDEVRDLVRLLVLAMKRAGIYFAGKRVTQSAVLNALVLGVDEATARELVTRGVARLEAILRDEPDPGPPTYEVRALGPGKVLPHRSEDADDPDPVREPRR